MSQSVSVILAINGNVCQMLRVVTYEMEEYR